MERTLSQKQGFVLDCCNQQQSKLKFYSSEKDIYLAGYFALKNKRLSKTQRSASKKSAKQIMKIGPAAYLSSPAYISPVHLKHHLSGQKTSKVPVLSPKVSSEDLLNLIGKHRVSNN